LEIREMGWEGVDWIGLAENIFILELLRSELLSLSEKENSSMKLPVLSW
jgi:hypothetical protein